MVEVKEIEEGEKVIREVTEKNSEESSSGNKNR